MNARRILESLGTADKPTHFATIDDVINHARTLDDWKVLTDDHIRDAWHTAGMTYGTTYPETSDIAAYWDSLGDEDAWNRFIQYRSFIDGLYLAETGEPYPDIL